MEVPLPTPAFSPKAVSSDYYYRIPVRPIYRGYPVYAQGKEPSGYIESLKRREPELLWDDTRHRPPLKTEADWIKAGEMVFDTAIFYDGVATVDDVRNPEWHMKVRPRTTANGILPYTTCVIRAIPPGVAGRHRASADSPPAIPDLIGIRDRQYLDRTGLVRQRSIGDLMRYAALNNELDFFSTFGDFIPSGKDFRELPEPTDQGVGTRLKVSYAAALYEQQAHTGARVCGASSRPRAIRHLVGRRRDGSHAHSQDPTRNRLLQSALAQGRLVSGPN